jgi:asparagine synthase (glutamine-hydrolysing)
MCGLAGYLVRPGHRANETPGAVLGAMGAAIVHRGPDDGGTWHDAAQGAGLSHRRLAIVDLSAAGRQPMTNADGRLVIAFNGEIYNFRELRGRLEAVGVRFRSQSDTEVLVEGIARWGVVETCRAVTGMFAFAVWDREAGCMWLGRDRLGKKPLYLWHGAEGFVFGSELKALRAFPGFAPALDQAALAEYLRFGYVPEHCSILSGVDKVLPGEVVCLRTGEPARRERYWTLAEAARRGVGRRIVNAEEARGELLALLREATRSRMVADVPLGAFLSGGIDSGLVVSLMQEATTQKVRTFSIGFHEAAFNEAPVARAVAAHLGTDHTELYVSDQEALDMVPRLADIFDEPFADASQIPTSLLASLTRRQVTVALTGDGGDEAFGGYARYRNDHGLLGWMYGWPQWLRQGMAAGLLAVPSRAWDGATQLVPTRRRPRFMGAKVAKVARASGRQRGARQGIPFFLGSGGRDAGGCGDASRSVQCAGGATL